MEVQGQLKTWLDFAAAHQASDLHLLSGMPPMIRVNSSLEPIEGLKALEPSEIETETKSLLKDRQRAIFDQSQTIDFSFSFSNHRVRANMYIERGRPAAALRLLPLQPGSFEELGLPPIIERFVNVSQGFFLVTGPTGHGKSTTLASMINYINAHRSDHIITIEDPIEYEFQHNRSIISQREVTIDTPDFHTGLRTILRQDPNVILIGEMRDPETIATALTAAETGHLVFSTLHTNNSADTANRVIDVFPPHRQAQIRQQFASVLTGIISQRLLPRSNGQGQVLATEIMVATPAVRSLIREGKTHQISNVIATSATDGMILLDKVLADLVSRGEITIDTAMAWAVDPKNMKMQLY